MFQFQNGSIKSKKAVRQRNQGDRFQFQNGSIKSCDYPHPCDNGRRKFQFQNGSIKSAILEGREVVEPPFQFQNGSIKSIFATNKSKTIQIVSIPKWFD